MSFEMEGTEERKARAEASRAMMAKLSPDGITSLTGMDLARARAMKNTLDQLQEAIANIGLRAERRDSDSGRQVYDRAWRRMRDLAVSFKDMTGESVSIPAYIEPPVNVAAQWLEV